MRIILLVVSTLWLAFTPTPSSADLRVVATVPTLAQLASEIGGSRVTVTSLTTPTQDPHFADAKPTFALYLNRADLLLSVGLSLEIGWLPTLQKEARNRNVLNGGKGFLDCSSLIDPMDVPLGRVDRSQGDVHPGGNPHYLYDPRRVLLVARGIAERMKELDSKHSGDYQKGLSHFEKNFNAALKKWEKDLNPWKGTEVVTYHSSFTYFLDWLEWKEFATIEPKPGIPPTPSHLARVMTQMKQNAIPLILQESYYPQKTAKLVAQKTGAKLFILASAPDFEKKQTYLEYQEQMIQGLLMALGK